MKATIRFISDRQDLIESMKLRKLGLESYMMDRLDMYWIEIQAGSKHVTYSVEPSYFWRNMEGARDDQRCWNLSRQYGDAHSEETLEFATQFFQNSEYEKNMQKWIKTLQDASYFTEGRYGSKSANTCPHCRGNYEIGTSHEHISYNDRIVAHSARAYQKAVELGLNPSWRPSRSPEDPSLEEKGELTKAIIPPIVFPNSTTGTASSSSQEPEKAKVRTIMITPKQMLYIFGNNNYDSIHITKIVKASTDAECIQKVMTFYEEFEELFEQNFTHSWSYGGFFEYIKNLSKDVKLGELTEALATKYSWARQSSSHLAKMISTTICGPDDVDYEARIGRSWFQEDLKKLKKDKDYRRKLVEENQDTMLQWITAYWKDPEGCGISVEVCDTSYIVE